jgi:hypothetical protein
MCHGQLVEKDGNKQNNSGYVMSVDRTEYSCLVLTGCVDVEVPAYCSYMPMGYKITILLQVSI